MCDLLHYLKSATGNKEGQCRGGWVDLAPWNIMGTVCQHHWDLAGKLFEVSNLSTLLKDDGSLISPATYAAAHAYPAQLLREYIALLCIMQSDNACMTAIAGLAVEAQNAIDHHHGHPDDVDDRFVTVKKKSRDYVRLSRLLSYYECYCFFRPNHVIFAGAISGGDFNFSLRQGLMPKDPGAGTSHGDYSHRLQWHIVMRVITNNFHSPCTGNWTRSPLQLFASLGEAPASARRVWGVVFDAQGRPGYSDPSKLFTMVRTRFANTPLGVQLIKSFSKRDTLERICDRELRSVLRPPGGLTPALQCVDRFMLPPIIQNLEVCIPAGVFARLYTWKKLGGAVASNTVVLTIPPVIHAPGAIPAAADVPHWNLYMSQLTTLAAARIWERHIADGASQVGKFLRGSRNTRYLVEQRTLRGATITMDSFLVDADHDRMLLLGGAERAAASGVRFNDSYQYNPGSGCKRIN